MAAKLTGIQEEVRRLKLDDSLLALNHIHSVSRGYSEDPGLETEFKTLKFRPPAFIIHFIAKQLLLNASNLGLRALDWSTFVRLTDLCIWLDDPIQHDPNWKHADPTGFFERIQSQQFPAQRLKPIQHYGLALGLFRDVGVVRWPEVYDLRREVEAELGLPIEQFMAMGHVCLALRTASHNGEKCMGTFTPMLLTEAYRQGIDFCVPEVWSRFLPRVACDRDTFRQTCKHEMYKTIDPLFVQFEFNPLLRFPITEVMPGHFVAVDPQLIVERTTFGLFYDMFERDRVEFATRFGYAFDQFVGQLLGSVCSVESLWSASAWEESRGQRKGKEDHSKIGDWGYVGHSRNVLFECKSLRPSLELSTYGSVDSVEKVTERIVSALEQLVGHNQAIQEGHWQSEGLLPKPVVCVVVTYGRINTINGPFTRTRIRQHLIEKGLEVPPFVILSLEELDSVVRLVELGRPLDDVVLALAHRDSFDVLRHFDDDLRERAVSSFVYGKGRVFMDSILPDNA